MTTIKYMVMPIDRKDIEYPSEDGHKYITESINDLARLWITEEIPNRTELTISGYENDSRELYEIPEVCQWARVTIKKFPVLLFFMKDTSIDRFVGWICGPLSREKAITPEFTKKYEETRMEYYIKAVAESSEFFTGMGVDKTIISKFYFQIMSEHKTM